MAERYKLTEKLIKAAELKSAKYHLFDSDLLGFSAVIHPSGLRAFCLHYWVQGRQRKLTIGRWPEWSVVAARERAKVLRREIDAGDDPMARREAQRAAPRIPDLIDLYIEQHLPRLSPRNASDQVSMLRNLVEPEWKTRLVADIMSDDVARLLTKIAEGRARPAKEKEKEKAKSRGKRKLQGQKPTPIRANRVGEVLRKMFNLSVRPWKMRDDTPPRASCGARRRSGSGSCRSRRYTDLPTPSPRQRTSVGRLAVVEEPRLIPDAGEDPWFLAADPARIDTVEYAYLEGQEGVFTETRTGFEVDGIEIKARHDFAAKAIDWRGLFRNPGAAPA